MKGDRSEPEGSLGPDGVLTSVDQLRKYYVGIRDHHLPPQATSSQLHPALENSTLGSRQGCSCNNKGQPQDICLLHDTEGLRWKQEARLTQPVSRTVQRNRTSAAIKLYFLLKRFFLVGQFLQKYQQLISQLRNVINSTFHRFGLSLSCN